MSYKHKLGDVDRARDILKDFDLMNNDDCELARKALRENGLPEFAVYVSKEIPTSDTGLEWGRQRLAEIRRDTNARKRQ